MSSALENLCGKDKPLAAEAPDAREFLTIKHSGLARLEDAKNPTLSLESAFDLAYGAAHALSLIALRAHGYRPRHRYIVFQVLPHTLGLGPEVWRVLDLCHTQRNLAEYEGSHSITPRLVADLITAASAVAEKLASIPTPGTTPLP